MLYRNSYDYVCDYRLININDIINPDSVLVVMCLWKRIQYLNNTLQYLEDQNIDKSITLCIWNNNKELEKKIGNIIDNFKSEKLKVIIHHSRKNIGGIGRFVFTKYICEQKKHFKNVIFIVFYVIICSTQNTHYLKIDKMVDI